MKFAKSLEFDQNAIEDLSCFVRKDRRKAEKNIGYGSGDRQKPLYRSWKT